MRLSEFITTNIDLIMQEWVNFARTRLPAAASMNELALRNDVVTILREVVADMGGSQTPIEQKEKSEGLRSTDMGIDSTPHRHATQRALRGFETLQLVSEYRALRAMVLRLWTESTDNVDVHDVEDVTRFNEAIDEALADSLKVFVASPPPLHLWRRFSRSVAGPKTTCHFPRVPLTPILCPRRIAVLVFWMAHILRPSSSGWVPLIEV